jgi:hypothetical protein
MSGQQHFQPTGNLEYHSRKEGVAPLTNDVVLKSESSQQNAASNKKAVQTWLTTVVQINRS